MNEAERKELRRKQRLEQYKANFGLDTTLWHKYRLKNFERLPGNELAYLTACSFLLITEKLQTPDQIYQTETEVDAWYDRQPKHHHFLTFAGDCGRGKTHLALGVGIAGIEIFEWQSIYYQVPELLMQLRSSFEDNSPYSFSGIMGKCKQADLLILDDLGMQKNTDWALEQLDSLIDFRYVNDLETVFTTNILPSKLPRRIASRIKEGEVVVLTGPDYREIIAQRRDLAREAQGIMQEGKR